jgi:branched-chain amino acid transport system ATP-binding protein
VTPALRTVDLTCGYAGTAVVRGLDLEVAAGEVLALLGPNGAGKTTVLSTIAGLLPAIGGTVELAGAPVLGVAPERLARRGLGFVPDDRGLFPSLTVDQHLELRLSRSERSTGRERVVGWFPALAGLLDRPVGLLSGGEQQMVALGQVLVLDPAVLLVDELSAGLAPIVVERLTEVLRDEAAASGGAVVLVEQHAGVALGVADRAVVLNHGDVVAAGPADELRRDWDVLVASYLG